MALNKDIEKRYFPLFLFFSRKFDSRVDVIKALIKRLHRIQLVAVAAKAGPEEVTRSNCSPTVIHVEFDVIWRRDISLFGEFDGAFNSVVHPYLRHGYH